MSILDDARKLRAAMIAAAPSLDDATASTTIPFQEFAKENQKPLAVIGGDI